VVFLNEDLLDGIIETDRPRPLELRKTDALEAEQQVMKLLEEKGVPTRRVLKFSGNLPFVGTRIDHDSEPSLIQLTLAIPGRDLRKGIWLEARHPGQLFSEYSKAIDAIVNASK